MRSIRLLFMALPVLAFTSCSRNIYVPNRVNAPLLKEKNEFKANLSLSNWQAAYAVSDNIAVMVNGQYVYRNFLYNSDDKSNDLFVDRYARGGVIEGAVGYFKPLGPDHRAVFDVYAGYGNGGFKTLDREYRNAPNTATNQDYLLRTRFSKFFLQPSFGLSHKVVEAAFSSRFSVVKFYDLEMGSKAFAGDTTRRDDFRQLGNKAVPFFEPAFTVRVGYRYVKWHAQLMFTVPINDETYSQHHINDYFQPVSLNIGVSLNFGQWVNDISKRK